MRKNETKNTANDQDWYSADAWSSAEGWDSADAWSSAEGNDSASPSRVSAPYIVQVVNACTSAISSVDIGDSYTNRTTSNFGQNSNITITSTISGVTYLEFLSQSESQPFQVGRTMIISTSAGQLDQTVAVTHRDAVGNRADHIITPTVDPYQNQTDRIIDDYSYLFDGFTRLRFNQINGSATVTVRMYPINKFVATQLIAGRTGLPSYNPPHLIKVAPSSVPAPKLIK